MTVHNASATTVLLSQSRRLHSMKCGPSSKLNFFSMEILSFVPCILHGLIIAMKKKNRITNINLLIIIINV